MKGYWSFFWPSWDHSGIVLVQELSAGEGIPWR